MIYISIYTYTIYSLITDWSAYVRLCTCSYIILGYNPIYYKHGVKSQRKRVETLKKYGEYEDNKIFRNLQ